MNPSTKLTYAIAAILGGGAIGAVHPASAQSAGTGNANNTSDQLQTITVTAQRRVQNVQDVPITIQALTNKTLTELNVTTFDDLIKYTPNVSSANLGPGQSSIFMRGLSVGVTGQQGTGTTGPIPNVAVYLDSQSTALPGRNLDIYAADMQRIEVLEGPQGTLFGSGAEAGVIRYITNKPNLDVTEGDVNAGYSYTAHGDPNTNVDAMLNLPIIPGKFALRGVIYEERRGGYIDNVPAVFQRAGTDEGFTLKNGGVGPVSATTMDNSTLAGSAINPVTYQGARLSGLYKVNDDWDVLLTESYQNMDAEGVFYQMPHGSEGVHFDQFGQPLGGEPLPPLSVTIFNPSYNKDKFSNTALTINGKVGPLKLVYDGAYLDRVIHQQQDYTNYSRGVWGWYYQCAGYASYSSTPGNGAHDLTCYSPSATWREDEKNTHQSHEIRLSTPNDWRLRGIGGIYWEEFNIYDDTQWTYRGVPTCSATNNTFCYNNVQPWPGQPSFGPQVRANDIGFFDDTNRTIIQRAAFASFDYDIVPKKLTVTVGTRYYHFNEGITGGDVGSFYCKTFATPTTYFGPCTSATNGNRQQGGIGIGGSAPYGTNFGLPQAATGQPINQETFSGFRSRANLSWHVSDDVLLYYTWSQGFRPGGFNRGTQLVQNGQYFTPAHYSPDTLINNELGWKTEFLDHHVLFNGAVYQEDWKNTIVEFFAPQLGFGNLTFVTNGPNYRVRGIELQAIARVTDGLTVTTSASYNHSYQTNSPALIDNNPANPNFGKPLPIQNVFNAAGSSLGESPRLQGNLRLRDEFALGDYRAFWQFGGQYYGPSYSTIGTVGNYHMGGWATFDASVGIGKDNWNVELFSQNIANRNASLYTNSAQFVVTQTPLRPRIAGVKFGYKF